MMAKLHKIMDTMLGKNLDAHVMGEYFKCVFPVGVDI